MPSRTSEFRSCVESSRLRLGSSSGVPEHKQRLLAGGKDGAGSRPKSEFGRAANQIAREISATVNKLDKLAQRAFEKCIRRHGMDEMLMVLLICPSWPSNTTRLDAQCSRETQDLVRRPARRDI